jgi:hypothetical protein
MPALHQPALLAQAFSQKCPGCFAAVTPQR